MSYIQVSICPKCGAPLYVESPWVSILPPPTIRSCSCFADMLQQTINTTTSSILVELPIVKREEGTQ